MCTQHYAQYGAFETGVEPSTGFNDDNYYAAKAAQMGGTTTPAQAKAAIQAAGLNAISHYQLYGKNESLSYTPTPAVVVGQTFTLTTGADTIVGGSGNDLVLGSVDTAANGGTFNNSDSITGGTGVDTLKLTVVDSGKFATGAVVSGVEVLNLRDVTSAGAAAMSLAGFAGLTDIIDQGSTVNSAVKDVQNNVTIGLKSTAKDFAVDFAADKIGSTKATLTLAVDGAGTSATSTSTITVGTMGATTDAFTKLAIDSSNNKSFITLAGTAPGDIATPTNLTVTGDASLNLAAGANVVFTGLTTVNASKMGSGGLTIDLTGNATGTTGLVYTGSSGADTVKFAAADLNVGMTLAGGSGSDTLSVSTAADATTVMTAAVAGRVTGLRRFV